MSRKAASSSQTLVYCLRAQGLIAARAADGEVQILARQGEDPPLARSYVEPYGVAYDAGAKMLWVADKFDQTVWALSISPKGSLKVKARHEDAGIRGPCMVDVHSEYGVLVGCYGDSAGTGSVQRHDGTRWGSVTPEGFRDRVTHVCWLPDGGYCYVTRSDSVLWYAEDLSAAAVPLTKPGKRELSPDGGAVGQLRLRYVQGLCYSPAREALLVADASLGAIYEVRPRRSSYELAAGKPGVSDSTWRTTLAREPRADTWLGPIRALMEDEKGRVLWASGEDGMLYALAEGKVKGLGSLLPTGYAPPVSGGGLTRSM